MKQVKTPVKDLMVIVPLTCGLILGAAAMVILPYCWKDIEQSNPTTGILAIFGLVAGIKQVYRLVRWLSKHPINASLNRINDEAGVNETGTIKKLKKHDWKFASSPLVKQQPVVPVPQGNGTTVTQQN